MKRKAFPEKSSLSVRVAKVGEIDQLGRTPHKRTREI